MKFFNLKINADKRYPSEPENLERSIRDTLVEKNISTQGAVVSVNSRILSESDYTSTFEDFGVKEGDTCVVSVVVKAVSA